MKAVPKITEKEELDSKDVG